MAENYNKIYLKSNIKSLTLIAKMWGQLQLKLLEI